MAINIAKHITGEINGIRCTIIETGITHERAVFLRELLEFNKKNVMEMKEESNSSGDEAKYTIGVTDLVFNPVYSIYECLLKTKEGPYVTPGYWKQECTNCDPRYWVRRKRVEKTTED
jgi:hypothetical protein